MSLASLPMYDLPEAAEATAELWRGLARHFRAAGIEEVPDRLTPRPVLPGHWLSPDLLFSQTCGYPLRNALRGRVRLIAAPCYAASGCAGPSYSSLLLVRAESTWRSLAGLEGARAAFNGRDSQSGYNVPRFMVAPFARKGRFFGEVIETGSHAASLEAVAAGRADVAAVDCVSFALLARYRRPALEGLRELCRGPAMPSLPYVTARGCDDDRLTRLRSALRAAMADPALAEARAALLLTGIAIVPESDYRRIDEMEARAVAQGYPVLA